MKKVLTSTLNGITAGLMIVIGSSAYLAVSNKVVGAILFSVALLTICYKGYSLYTGRIGLLLDNLNKNYIGEMLLGLFGNAIGTIIFGLLIRVSLFTLGETATALVELKFSQNFIETLIRGVFCGVLMYVAVSVFKEKNTIAGIIFAIPTFILCGFEHSIADMAYFAIGGEFSLKAFGFIMTVVLGNTLGALILPLFKLNFKEKKNEQN